MRESPAAPGGFSLSNWPRRSTKMEDATLEGGDLFVYGLGPHERGTTWMVGRALDAELVPKDDARWGSIAGGAAAGPLHSDGTAGDVPDLSYLATAEGTERAWLRHEGSKNEMWQVFAGVSPPLVYVYREYPKGNRHGALGAADVPTLGAAAVSTWGWTWAGWESFIDTPTVASMFMLPYKLNVAHAIFNRASYAVTPRMMWHVNKVRFEALNPDDAGDAKLIQDVLRGRIEPKVRWSPGLKGFNYEAGFRSTFGVDPILQTRREILVSRLNEIRPLGVE